MTTIEITSRVVCSADPGDPLAEAHLAAAAFLARYQGRTLDAYRYHLRVFFQWALEVSLDVLVATRPQIVLYVRALEERGLAPATIDRRLSTVCGFCRFRPHRRPDRLQPRPVRPPPQSPAPRPAVSNAPSWAGSCSPRSDSTGPTLRWRSCWA
jgi:site-specific recombinase XerD